MLDFYYLLLRTGIKFLQGTLTFRIYRLVCTYLLTHTRSIASQGVYVFMNCYVYNIYIITLSLIPDIYIICTVIDETVKFSLYFHGSSAVVGLGPSGWGFEITLRHITLGRTPLDEWSARRRDRYRTKRNTRNRYPCPRRDSKPSIPASERPRTHTLDSAATGICKVSSYMNTNTDTHWKVKCSDERLLTRRRTDNYNECNVPCLRVIFWNAQCRENKSNATQPTQVSGFMSSRNTWI